MAKIKLLSNDIINQIAAGEIVNGPHSALKEVIENAIDAEARNIDIFVKDGGMSKIVVEDDGVGMDKDDLLMSIERHATSKLNANNLFEIYSYGFRGEAIPSIASISNFSIESKGCGVRVSYSEKSKIYSSNTITGTRVSILDIFARTPARLKFMKSVRTELSKCVEIVENFSLVSHGINFNLRNDNGEIILFTGTSLEEKVLKIYTQEIFEKSVYFKEEFENMTLYGYLFHPSHSKYSSNNSIKLFVNKRFVKNRMVNTAVKIGYRNIIEGVRFPMAIIYIDIDPFWVDMNVSPTKSDVLFRDESGVQKLIVRSVLKNVQKFNKIALDFNFTNGASSVKQIDKTTVSTATSIPIPAVDIIPPQRAVVDTMPSYYKLGLDIVEKKISEVVKQISVFDDEEKKQCFFGKALIQIFDTYIISYNEETGDCFIIDQHAVHEKMTMNSIFKNIENEDNIKYLLRQEIINFSVNLDSNIKEILEKYNFKIDIVHLNNMTTISGSNALETASTNTKTIIMVKAIPGILSNEEAVCLIKDIVDGNDDCDINDYIRRRIADIACHNSIRAGQKLSIYEMNQLLEDMEKEKDIYQCNHHRPSFVKFSKNNLDKMFERN